MSGVPELLVTLFVAVTDPLGVAVGGVLRGLLPQSLGRATGWLRRGLGVRVRLLGLVVFGFRLR
jgi:hypothetical protein